MGADRTFLEGSFLSPLPRAIACIGSVWSAEFIAYTLVHPALGRFPDLDRFTGQ
jgi:hypothetical protein